MKEEQKQEVERKKLAATLDFDDVLQRAGSRLAGGNERRKSIAKVKATIAEAEDQEEEGEGDEAEGDGDSGDGEGGRELLHANFV
jgi:ABC-type hemin transport system ATPase subunit